MSRPWVTAKFGGTSVATVGTWNQIVARSRQLLASGHRVWLVVSALSKVRRGPARDAAPRGARAATGRHVTLAPTLRRARPALTRRVSCRALRR